MPAQFLDRSVSKGRTSAEEADAAMSRLHAASGLDELASCDLIIEAVFEDFALKASLFADLGQLLPETTLVATNTSCLRVSDLAGHMASAERFLGLHYFSPAQVNPIVEVVRGEVTATSTIERALAFTHEHGKQPITCKDAYGFAINRFFCPYTNEAARALDDGLGTTAEIDAVAREAVGAAAGPFLVMNLIKPRINLHAIRNLGPLGEFYAPAKSMIECGEADAAWTIDDAGEIDAVRQRSIADRLLAGVFLPVLQELDEEIATPADIDHGARQALKLSKAPCTLMDQLGATEVERILRPALERHGIAMPASIARIGQLVAP